jgi:hypothetical protein
VAPGKHQRADAANAVVKHERADAANALVIGRLRYLKGGPGLKVGLISCLAQLITFFG